MALDFRMEFDLYDTARFCGALKRTEKLPQRIVNKAASKGAVIAGQAVKVAAPRGKTRQLSKGFKRKAEKSRKKGKKVYHYAMDSAKNDIFQKPIKNPGVAGGKKKYAYYPSSIEYGFLTRSKGGGLKYVKGTHFARNAAAMVRPQVDRAIIRTLTAELEKEWMKK